LDANKLEALKDLIKEKGIVVNINGITLSSGKSSIYYYDLKKIALDPKGANLIADLLFEEISILNARSVGGLEIGAIPITTAILMKSAKEHQLSGFVVRKHAKEHGLKYTLEGNLDHPVVIVDDVLTTGASLMKAMQAIRDEKEQCQVYAIVQAFGFQAIHRRRNTETRRAKNSGITTIFQHPSKTPDESTEPNNL
jgi:orotate phosphoribosyltransferase